MTSITRPPDFPASTHQVHAVRHFQEHFANFSKLISEPTEGEIRLGGTRHKYKVLIDVYAIPPHAFGLNIWAPSDEARLRIRQHRDMWGRIHVTLGELQFDAVLETFVSDDHSQVVTDD